MRSSLDWMTATMQLSLIRRYCSNSWYGFQNKFQTIFKPCHLSELEFTSISWVFQPVESFTWWEETLCEAHGRFSFPQENSDKKKNSLLQVDQSSVRNSYSVFSLLRWEKTQWNISWKKGLFTFYFTLTFTMQSN